MGYPIQINDQKYLRNAYYFNLCFVCDHTSHTLHYESIVKKLSNFLVCAFTFIFVQDYIASEMNYNIVLPLGDTNNILV